MSAAPLIVYDDDKSDVLYITTDARLDNSKGAIAEVAIGFDEPFESEQRAYAAELVERYNSHEPWIPVSEGLPESDGWYEVTAVNEDGADPATHVTHFSRQVVKQGRRKVVEPYWPMNVIAWRRLRPPYIAPVRK